MKRKLRPNKKTYIILIITVVLLLIMMVSLNIVLDARLSGAKQQSQNNKVYKYHIAMIGADSSDEFWTTIYEGARVQGDKLDSYVENFGADLTTKYSTKELMKMAIAAQVDGIIVEADKSEEMTALVDKAADQGIPVITILNDASSSRRICFVGGNDYTLGEIYGNQIIYEVEKKLENGEEGQDKISVTVLVNSSSEKASSNLVYSAVKDTVAEISSKIDLESVLIDNQEEFQAEEMIRSKILSPDSRPDILVCLSVADTISAYQNVIDYNMVGKVSIIGYYSSQEILEGIQKGIIKSAVSVNAEEMGEISIKGMHDYITEDYISDYLPVSSELITQTNVEQYIKSKEQ